MSIKKKLKKLNLARSSQKLSPIVTNTREGRTIVCAKTAGAFEVCATERARGFDNTELVQVTERARGSNNEELG